MTHSATPRVPLFCSYHILTSSRIYYWTDARQHGIYLLNVRTAVLNKMTCAIHFSCKISDAFSASSFCLSFGNVKIILNNPNPTSSLWVLPGKDLYFNVSILTLFVSIFIEYLYFVWLCFHYNLEEANFSLTIWETRLSVFVQLLGNWLCCVRIIKTFPVFLHRSSWELIVANQK